MNTKQFAIDYLNGLADGCMPASAAAGLCGNLEDHSRIPEELAWALHAAMAHWPEGTGSNDYPVPSLIPSATVDDAAAAYLSARGDSRWANTSYGDSRRRLCKWLADELANGNIKVEEESYYEQI